MRRRIQGRASRTCALRRRSAMGRRARDGCGLLLTWCGGRRRDGGLVWKQSCGFFFLGVGEELASGNADRRDNTILL